MFNKIITFVDNLEINDILFISGFTSFWKINSLIFSDIFRNIQIPWFLHAWGIFCLQFSLILPCSGFFPEEMCCGASASETRLVGQVHDVARINIHPWNLLHHHTMWCCLTPLIYLSENKIAIVLCWEMWWQDRLNSIFILCN